MFYRKKLFINVLEIKKYKGFKEFPEISRDFKKISKDFNIPRGITITEFKRFQVIF